jgi:hypothetical protein
VRWECLCSRCSMTAASDDVLRALPSDTARLEPRSPWCDRDRQTARGHWPRPRAAAKARSPHAWRATCAGLSRAARRSARSAEVITTDALRWMRHSRSPQRRPRGARVASIRTPHPTSTRGENRDAVLNAIAAGCESFAVLRAP